LKDLSKELFEYYEITDEEIKEYIKKNKE